MTTTLMIGLLIPLLGTMLGSAFVFFMKDEMSARLQKSLLGFASGVMVAASVWSLLIPAMKMGDDNGKWAVLPAAVGFLLGMGFLLLIDELTPHLHIGTDKPEGMRSHLSKTAMLALAVTIHNLPEGMAVGVVFAGADSGATSISLASAVAVFGYRHPECSGGNYYLHADAGSRQQPLALVPAWFSERNR
jgi:ZIP family zinc transporter